VIDLVYLAMAAFVAWGRFGPGFLKNRTSTPFRTSDGGITAGC
jgi:hypothetical protein